MSAEQTEKFPFAVRLIGFPPQAAAAIARGLQRAPDKGPAYFCLSAHSLQEPDLYLANGTQLATLAALDGLTQGDSRPALVLGAPGLELAHPDFPYPNLRVPVQWDSVYHELGKLVERRAEALAERAASGLPPLPERRRAPRVDLDLTDPTEYMAMRRPPPQGEVLVVDRSGAFAQHITKLMRRHGLAASWAGSQQEAEDACRSRPVALVLVNTSLPGLDPYATSLEMSTMGSDPKVDTRPAVVLLLAEGMAFDEARAAACGIAGSLDKPVSDATLRSVLKRLMRLN
jgi:CheY-like chemotaxis protein